MDCRLCLTGDSEVYTKMDTQDYLKQLELIMPEIDLNLTESPHICESCSVLLSNAYAFKLNCLRVEETLRSSLDDTRDKSESKGENETKGQGEDDTDDSSVDQTVRYSEVLLESVKEEPMLECEETEVTYEDPLKKGSAEETFLCKFCGLKLDTYPDWYEHIKAHSGTKNNCNVCLKGFKSRSQLLSHKETHRVNKCRFCGQEFLYKSTFAKHMREQHPGEKQPKQPARAAASGPPGTTGRFECGTCGLRTIEKNSLIAHMRRHTGERPFKCRQCSKAFAQNSTLTTHVRMVHLPDRPFRCEVCDKAYAVRGLYNLHLKLAHGGAPKEHVCERCGKAFSRRSKLTEHAGTHSGETAAVCRVCNEEFVNVKRLKKHLQTHNEDRPFACAICERRFTKQYNMQVHVKSCARRNWRPKGDAE